MKPLGNLSRTERSSFAFQEWMDGLHKGGLWGSNSHFEMGACRRR
jgi:hypothetical protein